MGVPRCYALFCRQLVALLDEGAKLPLQETRDRIDGGMIFAYLQDHFGLVMIMAYHTKSDLLSMLTLFQDLNLRWDPFRTLGVENNGLCLLLGFSIEGLERETIKI